MIDVNMSLCSYDINVGALISVCQSITLGIAL